MDGEDKFRLILAAIIFFTISASVTSIAFLDFLKMKEFAKKTVALK